MMPRPTGRGMLYGLGGYCWLTQKGGLEGFALQEAFGFAPGSGGKAARTRCSGAAGPRTPSWRAFQRNDILAWGKTRAKFFTSAIILGIPHQHHSFHIVRRKPGSLNSEPRLLVATMCARQTRRRRHGAWPPSSAIP